MSSLAQRAYRRPVHYFRRLWHEYGIFWLGAVLVGLVSVLYARLMDYGYGLFQTAVHAVFWAPLIVTPLIGALCAWLTRTYFAGSEGSGIPQVIAILHSGRASLGATLLSPRILIGKIAISFVAILGGFTIGREGPTVQVGAALMFALRRFYRRSHIAIERQMALAGAAAGLSAAFNTPLAGIVFAIEELTRSFEQRTSGILITAIIFAGVVALALDGNYTYFGRLTVGSLGDQTALIIGVIGTGVVTGIAGGTFGWLLLNTPKWMPARVLALRATRPVVFAACCGFIVAVLGVLSKGMTFGSGYAEARGLLYGQGHMTVLYPLLKMASMIGSYLPGIPGGIFAPSLAIGAGFGNLMHMALGQLSLPLLIALAMVGYLAAVTQAPITAFVIVMEMIDGHALVISLMASALIASRVARCFAPPLYEALSQRYIDGGAPNRHPEPPHAGEATSPSTHSEAGS